MVNASLNWASIVGIVLAVGGALLYFMRSFKPALARDYDVFFAAIGLLCGGILFFQGWRLDPILQFGQFLLAATTVFFAYESVRLRGVTTEQARRSAYFEDEDEPPLPYRPRGGLGGSAGWDSDADRFDEPEPISRRIRSRGDAPEDDFYRPRRASRVAIPERAASRRPDTNDWEPPARGGGTWEGRPGRGREPDPDLPRGTSQDPGPGPGRYRAGPERQAPDADFGARRRDREGGGEVRRGSRPAPSPEAMPRSSRRAGPSAERPGSPAPSAAGAAGVPQGTPIRPGTRIPQGDVSDADFSPINNRRSGPQPPATGAPRSTPSRSPVPPSRETGAPGRDNSSRFDD